MNKIDTLILSGGGPSSISYIGIFKALFEKKILTKNLSGIHEIITTSAGILFSIFYMINVNESIIENIILRTDMGSILNIDNLEIDNLLVDFGLFDNDKIGESVESYIKHILNIKNITLKEFYEKIPIKLTVKTYNTTKKKLEYINYENNPNLKLSLLAQMTTAIPFFFKPIQYNDSFYVDGGLRGNFPIEDCKSDKYLGIFIKGSTCKSQDNNIFKIFPILEYILSLMNESTNINDYNKKRIILSEINQGLNFDLSDKLKKEIIQKGYNTTINHIEKYLIE